MKTITNLTGIAVEAPVPNLHAGWAMHEEPVPGYTRQLRFGTTGAILISGQSTLLIPTQAIWDLAATIDPAFVPPAAPAAVPRAVRARRASAPPS